MLNRYNNKSLQPNEETVTDMSTGTLALSLKCLVSGSPGRNADETEANKQPFSFTTPRPSNRVLCNVQDCSLGGYTSTMVQRTPFCQLQAWVGMVLCSIITTDNINIAVISRQHRLQWEYKPVTCTWNIAMQNTVKVYIFTGSRTGINIH